ncbi:MAG: hypothetical protein R2939_08985 [Kofleriaceae bacterium]
MTTSGTRWAVAIVLALAFFLPVRLPCSFPGQDCAEIRDKRLCRDGDLEPLGFYLVERVLRRDLGFAYSTTRACE